MVFGSNYSFGAMVLGGLWDHFLSFFSSFFSLKKMIVPKITFFSIFFAIVWEFVANLGRVLEWFWVFWRHFCVNAVFLKIMFFLRKNKVFSKNRLSKITSISASILVPTCLHVALENRRFSDFWRFQEAFKISCFFASMFSWFWLRLGLQHGAILGAKTAQNPKKWL